jgi:hypothetical protein
MKLRRAPPLSAAHQTAPAQGNPPAALHGHWPAGSTDPRARARGTTSPGVVVAIMIRSRAPPPAMMAELARMMGRGAEMSCCSGPVAGTGTHVRPLGFSHSSPPVSDYCLPSPALPGHLLMARQVLARQATCLQLASPYQSSCPLQMKLLPQLRDALTRSAFGSIQWFSPKAIDRRPFDHCLLDHDQYSAFLMRS